MEGLRGKPGECNQQEVVCDSRHGCTPYRALQSCHMVVDEESQVKQEQGRHKVDENVCCCRGLFFPEKVVHKENYAEEQHGQTTADLCDEGEVFYVWTSQGFIQRSIYQ